MKFQGYTIKKDVRENLPLIEHCDGRKGRGKQQVTYLIGLGEWIAEWGVRRMVKCKTLLKAIRNRKLMESYDHPHPIGTC